MAIFEVLMHDMQHKTPSYQYYIPLFICFGVSLWLYRRQVAITEVDYLKEMIEHHDMALFTSKNILDKPNISPRVRLLATRIVNDQTKEIGEMKGLIKEENNKIISEKV
jgi:hypothetical protein